MDLPDAVTHSANAPIDLRRTLPRLQKRFLQWRPAVLSGRGNRVEGSGLGGAMIRLGTAFWGPSSDNVVRVGQGFGTHGVSIRVAGQGNRIEIGAGVRFSGKIEVRGFGLTVRIGDRCDFKRSESLS